MKRWWIYQKERFPVFQHGLLVAAFSSSAVAYSALQTTSGRAFPAAYGVAFVVSFLFFLQLRIADEFKDAEEDARYRPYRPVPRGLVSLRELGLLFALAAAVQGLAALWLAPRLGLLLLVAWLYLALMSREFFVRDWLKRRPVTYLWTHMLIMPLVDFFATACHWLPLGEKPELAWFLAASFANGLVIEIGRKIRVRADEEEGVPTYSRLWGEVGAAWLWLACAGACLLCGWLAAREISFADRAGFVFALMWAGAAAGVLVFLRRRRSGAHFEWLSALNTLVLYLTLGLWPLLTPL